jgi:hypothetical protein
VTLLKSWLTVTAVIFPAGMACAEPLIMATNAIAVTRLIPILRLSGMENLLGRSASRPGSIDLQ